MCIIFSASESEPKVSHFFTCNFLSPWCQALHGNILRLQFQYKQVLLEKKNSLFMEPIVCYGTSTILDAMFPEPP